MRKLRLERDDLRVDTFATSGSAASEQGTVRAHGGDGTVSYDQPCEPVPHDYTDVNCPPYTRGATCAASCYGSCYGSCNASCYNTCYTCDQNTCANASCDPCYPVPNDP